MASRVRRSTLALAVLALLAEAPMHPYRMQQLIRQRGKDKVVNVGQRASLYKAIERLEKAGLVAARETSREGLWPERTTYELTDTGREMLGEWMRDALSAPRAEFPEFPAALSFLALVTPRQARAYLEQRRTRLATELAALEAGSAAAAGANVPRLFLVEDEYRAAILRAELEWVAALLVDLTARRLTWSEAWARRYASEADG